MTWLYKLTTWAGGATSKCLSSVPMYTFLSHSGPVLHDLALQADYVGGRRPHFLYVKPCPVRSAMALSGWSSSSSHAEESISHGSNDLYVLAIAAFRYSAFMPAKRNGRGERACTADTHLTATGWPFGSRVSSVAKGVFCEGSREVAAGE